MSNRTRRVLTVLCLSLALCLPLQAQVVSGPGDGSWSSLLSALWGRLSAPLVSLWLGDETEGRGIWDPNGANSEGRGIMDPDGATSEGRGGWDPNGATNKNDVTGTGDPAGYVEPDPGTIEGRGGWDPDGAP